MACPLAGAVLQKVRGGRSGLPASGIQGAHGDAVPAPEEFVAGPVLFPGPAPGPPDDPDPGPDKPGRAVPGRKPSGESAVFPRRQNQAAATDPGTPIRSPPT